MPFSLAELEHSIWSPKDLDTLLFTGLYPAIYDRKIAPIDWYSNYIQTYVERDVRQMMNIKELSNFQKFIRLCAGRCGSLLNLSNLGNECGISHNTAAQWLSILEASFIIIRLQPHFRNFSKRLIKSTKIYFLDCGLMAWLLGIRNVEQMRTHPLRPQLFETLIISEIYKSKFNLGEAAHLFFWRDRSGLEVDLVSDKGQTLLPIEIKSGATITDDFFITLKKWKKIAGKISDKPSLVYGGDENQERSEVNIYSWKKMLSLIKKC